MKQQSIRMRVKLSGAFLMAIILTAGCGAGMNDTVVNRSDANVLSSVSEEESQVQVDGSETDKVSGDNTSEQSDSSSKMPAFTTKDLDGNTVTEDIFGEKDLTVLNIWGTFCGPCIREMPELGEWAKEMPDNVQIVGLVIDIAGDEDTEHHDLAVDIIESADADFMQMIVNADFTDILKDVIGVPTTIFVDKDGNIVGDPVIGADVNAYKKFVEDYLDGQ